MENAFFKRHFARCTVLTDMHVPTLAHMQCVAVACFRLMRIFQILCLFYTLCIALQPHNTLQGAYRLLRLMVYRVNHGCKAM